VSNQSGGQTPQVLSGLRVVDFGQYVAGPMVAQILADYGADVVRIDPPGGPVWKHTGNAVLQRGKRSIVLDLKDPSDNEVARKLAERADIVVENFRPGVMNRLGLGWDDLKERNPRLIHCSIPGFASDDPRSTIYATEGVVSAEAGLYPSQDFDPDGEPVVNTLPLASSIAAMIATHSIVAALIAREKCGLGQKVEVSLYDAAFELLRFYTDKPPQEDRKRIQLGGARAIAIARSYKCSDDRYVRVTWMEKRQLEVFAKFVGKYDDWKAKGFFDLGVTRAVSDLELSDRFGQEAQEIFLTKPAQYWEKEIGAEADLVMIRTSEEFLVYDEHAKIIEASVERVDPELGITYQAGLGFNMLGTPGLPGVRHELDADRAAILAELEIPQAEIATSTSGPINLKAALEDTKVLDMTVLLAGPGAGRVLAEYGATVMHVGRPNWNGMRFHYQVHIGKQSILLDLKNQNSKAVFDRMLEKADVISTNFSQSVARRLGVEDASVRKIKPDVIYSRISAHGAWGPREEFRGHEEVGQAATGALVRFSGTREGNMQFFAINDSGTGHVAAIGILLGLYHRLKTGEGQFVGASLAQTSVLYQLPFMVAHGSGSWRDDPGGLDYRGSGPLDRIYKASDGRWIYLAVKANAGWQELVETEDFQSLAGQDKADAELLETKLANLIADKPARHWASLFTAARNVGLTVVATIDEPMDDPWARSHGLAQEVHFPEAGVGLQVGPAPRLSLTPMKLGAPVGPPGCDTDRILGALGMTSERERLVASGALATELGEVEAH
jgi:crotonobetainyl-CoA:carnitine CoA-transferase CaiB-like acyl-CoA transferase